MRMTKSDAGKLGYAKTCAAMDAGRESATRKAIAKWEQEARHCPTCGERIPYSKRKNKFCNHSCAASSVNVGVRRHGTKRSCLLCGNPVRTKFCSTACQNEYFYREKVQAWLRGDSTGLSADGLGVLSFVRRWILERDGHRCSVCLLAEWQGEPIPLVLDHIDGNAHHNTSSNLRMVCGNCNMQLPTFAGRNRGNGTRNR